MQPLYAVLAVESFEDNWGRTFTAGEYLMSRYFGNGDSKTSLDPSQIFFTHTLSVAKGMRSKKCDAWAGKLEIVEIEIDIRVKKTF